MYVDNISIISFVIPVGTTEKIFESKTHLYDAYVDNSTTISFVISLGTTEKIFESKTHLYDVYVDNSTTISFVISLGTTEKIFESKTHLYEVYVVNQNVTTRSHVLKESKTYDFYIDNHTIVSFVPPLGTTEKIFESKTHLYDVYVDNQNVTTPSQVLKELLKVSEADKDKFAKLNNQRYEIWNAVYGFNL